MYGYKGRSRALRLTDLPRELRDHIYDYVVVEDRAIGVALTHAESRILGTNWEYDEPSRLIQPSLTRVSRQIREEALEVFYKQNTFIANLERRVRDDDDLRSNRSQGPGDSPSPGDSYKVLKKWLRCVGLTNTKNIDRLLLFRIPHWDGKPARTLEDVEFDWSDEDRHLGWVPIPDKTEVKIMTWKEACEKYI